MNTIKEGIIGLLLVTAVYSKAGTPTYYSIGSGDFSSTSVWSTTSASGPSCGCTPSGGNIIIIIEPGDNITYNTPSSYTLGNSNTLTISAGATFNLGSDSLLINGSGIVTVSGTIIANGIDVSGSGKLTINAGATVTDNGNFTSSGSGGTTDNGGLTVSGNAGFSGSGKISGTGTMSATGTTYTSGGGKVWGSGGVSCTHCTSSSSGTSLPIDLLSYTAVDNNGIVYLTWASATETNNKYYTIERSADGTGFTLVANISGARNSTSPIDYSATDESPESGLNYYRLSQTDFDGNTTILGVLPVAINVSVNGLKVFPNPAKDNCVVSFNDTKIELLPVRMYDYMGREMLTDNMQTAIGVNSVELDISKFSPGIYFIAVPSNGKVINTKFIKE